MKLVPFEALKWFSLTLTISVYKKTASNDAGIKCTQRNVKQNMEKDFISFKED